MMIHTQNSTCYFNFHLMSCLLVFFHFSVHPLIQVPNQLVGAPLGTDVTIVCNVEASPKAINYWQRENGKIITFFCPTPPLLHVSISNTFCFIICDF